MSRPATLEKALKINLARTIYGTFAEIGAGQEIAHWFYRAGGASGTVAKTMSAYDKTFSDEIYGRAARYVSRQRLSSMLDHEHEILLQRLEAERGADTTFFALANTVRAKAYGEAGAECHGWLGLRFQAEPRAPANDILVHVRLLDDSAGEQADAVGILGVNLLYAAYHERGSLPGLLATLMDGLNRWRIEVDMVKLTGPAFQDHAFADRLVALQLVQSGLTDAALFGANGEIWNASDVLHNKPVFLKRGSFNPITKLNLDMIERGSAAFMADFGAEADGRVEILEITMDNLLSESSVDYDDFIARADILQALGKNVLISKFAEFHRVSGYLARHTRRPIGIVLGLPLFEQIFDEKWYTNLAGGLLESLGRLFRNQVRLYVYPAGDRSTGAVRTALHARLTKNQKHLLAYLLHTGAVRVIEEAARETLFYTSAEIREMIASGDPRWRGYVPEIVAERW